MLSTSNVELLNVMGDDLMVVNAARVSMHKESSWEWLDHPEFKTMTFQLRERDKKLIRYLATHGHWTPFSQPQLQFRIRMPIFVVRQWYKHQMGFTRNEVSRRYVTETPALHTMIEWLSAPENSIKQGSGGPLHPDAQRAASEVEARIHEAALDAYDSLLNLGVSAEQARKVLPLDMYTEFIETASLYGYARLYRLRSKPDAQREIRTYAELVGEECKRHFPVSWEALTSA